MSMPSTPAEIRALLNLQPHPEGGWFAETWRSADHVEHPLHDLHRPTSTAIYYLLEAGQQSAFHMVDSEEVWHLYAGGPAELHLIDWEGRHERHVLGTDLTAGERPQVVVPAGTWQATRLRPGTAFALFGCTVAPGFDFSGFEMPPAEELLTQFPQNAAIIKELGRKA